MWVQRWYREVRNCLKFSPGALLMYKKFCEEWHHICIPVNKTAWASLNHNNFFQILRRKIYFVSQSSSQNNIHSFLYLFFYPLSPLLCIRSHLVTCSVAQLCPTVHPHGLHHARPSCPSPTPGAYSNSCLSSQWCHPTISSSVIPFSFCLQSFPAERLTLFQWVSSLH